MNDKFTAWGQLVLSLLFLSGYFLVIILFMLGYARIPTDYKEAFAGLLSLMTGGGLTILYFWFSRARAQALPDPNTEVTMRTVATRPPEETEVTHEGRETIDRPIPTLTDSLPGQPTQDRADR